MMKNTYVLQNKRAGRRLRRGLGDAGYQTGDGAWTGLVPTGSTGYRTGDGEWSGVIPVGLSGWFGDVVHFVTEPMVDLVDTIRGKDHVVTYGSGDGVSPECQAARDKASADLDAQVESLIRAWKPVDVYSVSDMEKMVTATMKLLTDTVAAVDQAMAPALTYRASLQQAKDWLNTKRLEGQEFVMASITARAKGAAGVQSTSFKRWVINSMNKSSVAIGHIAYMACIKPAILSLFQGCITLFKKAIEVGKAMVKFVIDVGKLLLKLPDVAGDVMKYLKYGAFAAAAYYVYTRLQPKRA
jgi:hypothetical protein